MLQTHADSRVLGYLGRALSFELSAVQLYTTQARLLGIWGLVEESARLREEAREELTHAERIIARMLALSVAPNASQLRPVKLGESLHDLLAYDVEFELELVHLYNQAVEHCSRVGDQDNRVFFESLLNEEKAHARELTEWLSKIGQAGASGGSANAS